MFIIKEFSNLFLIEMEHFTDPGMAAGASGDTPGMPTTNYGPPRV